VFELAVSAEQRGVEPASLGDEQAIQWISVMTRQFDGSDDVVQLNGEHCCTQTEYSFHYSIRGKARCRQTKLRGFIGQIHMDA
jgi:hypothetical protein